MVSKPLLAALKVGPKTVLVVNAVPETLDRALRNNPSARIRLARDLTSYQAMLADELVVTKAALAELTQRLGDGSAEVKQ